MPAYPNAGNKTLSASSAQEPLPHHRLLCLSSPTLAVANGVYAPLKLVVQAWACSCMSGSERHSLIMQSKRIHTNEPAQLIAKKRAMAHEPPRSTTTRRSNNTYVQIYFVRCCPAAPPATEHRDRLKSSMVPDFASVKPVLPFDPIGISTTACIRVLEPV